MAEYILRDAALREAKYACVRGLDPMAFIEDIPAADVAPIEALERLRDELCASDQITMGGLRKLNTLIWKYTQEKNGGTDHV